MVYAVEASDMAGYCRRLAAANPRKSVIHVYEKGSHP